MRRYCQCNPTTSLVNGSAGSLYGQINYSGWRSLGARLTVGGHLKAIYVVSATPSIRLYSSLATSFPCAMNLLLSQSKGLLVDYWYSMFAQSCYLIPQSYVVKHTRMQRGPQFCTWLLAGQVHCLQAAIISLDVGNTIILSQNQPIICTSGAQSWNLLGQCLIAICALHLPKYLGTLALWWVARASS